MNICMWGVGGKNGNKFLNSVSYKRLKKMYGGGYVCDNDKRMRGNWNGIEVKDISDIKQDDDVLIVTGAYPEVYEQLKLVGVKSKISIWDEKADKVVDYKNKCFMDKTPYRNDNMIFWESEHTKCREKSLTEFAKTGDMLRNLTDVCIELSNLCNYAIIHKKCPASCIKEKVIMPSIIVKKILDELSDNMYQNYLCLQVYNEPMIDPRLFEIIRYAKAKMPKVKIYFFTNGYYCNNVMLQDMEEVGVDATFFTAYGNDEWERLMQLSAKIPISIHYGILDDRMDRYDENDEEKSIICNKGCGGIVSQCNISSNGELQLCCYDYKHSCGIGNIYRQSLTQILNDEKLIEAQKLLLQGDRTQYGLCKNCTKVR